MAEGEGGPAPATATGALAVEHEPAEADGGHHHPDPAADTVTAGVPDEPGTTEPDDASRTGQDGTGPEGAPRDAAGSGVGAGSGVERPVGPAGPGEVPDGVADPGQGRDGSPDPGLVRDGAADTGLVRDGSPGPDSGPNRFRAVSADPNRLQDASAGLDRDQLSDGLAAPDRDRLPDDPADLARDRHQVGPTDPDSDQLGDGPADPDLGRTAPVEPGLPGSTAASPYGATATVDKGAAPSGHPADEPLRAPDEPGWAPGAAGSFEEPVPVDPPAGASDRWREAKLAAERDRIARAAAAQPEERSPLERARRRLERLVGVGQEPADHDEISPADREAAERARRARLGLDEEDQPRR
jgi:hypothetical protein